MLGDDKRADRAEILLFARGSCSGSASATRPRRAPKRPRSTTPPRRRVRDQGRGVARVGRQAGRVAAALRPQGARTIRRWLGHRVVVLDPHAPDRACANLPARSEIVYTPAGNGRDTTVPASHASDCVSGSPPPSGVEGRGDAVDRSDARAAADVGAAGVGGAPSAAARTLRRRRGRPTRGRHGADDGIGSDSPNTRSVTAYLICTETW